VNGNRGRALPFVASTMVLTAAAVRSGRVLPAKFRDTEIASMTPKAARLPAHGIAKHGAPERGMNRFARRPVPAQFHFNSGPVPPGTEARL
jgi:hypothetical protein